MKHFSPLSDRTAIAHNCENVAARKDAAAAVVASLPSYAATMAVRRPLQKSSSANATSAPYTHNPYAATVLREPMYSARSSECASLDVSHESSSSSSSNTPLIVKTPIRRVYRNGRPVPVYSDAPTSEASESTMTLMY